MFRVIYQFFLCFIIPYILLYILDFFSMNNNVESSKNNEKPLNEKVRSNLWLIVINKSFFSSGSNIYFCLISFFFQPTLDKFPTSPQPVQHSSHQLLYLEVVGGEILSLYFAVKFLLMLFYYLDVIVLCSV